MSEKYGYLKNQWRGFYREIDKDLKSSNDTNFKEYVGKIRNETLTLDDYTNRKVIKENYFCNFMENASTKLYGSASVGNAKYFGIKLNEDGETYYVSKSIEKEKSNLNKQDAEIKFKEILLPELMKICEKVNVDKEDDIFKIVEQNNPIPSRVMLRKIVAMNNPGKFLYIYSDEAINTIYDFFLPNENDETNIEKNYKLTSELIKIFQKKDKEDDDFYLITQLSHIKPSCFLV